VSPERGFHDLARRLIKGRPPGDWALLALLTVVGLVMLFSERFWSALPF
jgi:hypothetical protein